MSDVNVNFTNGISSGSLSSNYNNMVLIARDRTNSTLPSNWGTTERVRRFENLQEVVDAGISKTSVDYYQAMQFFREAGVGSYLYMGIYQSTVLIEDVIHDVMALYPVIDVLGFYDKIALDKDLIDGLAPVIRTYRAKEKDNRAISVIYSADTSTIDVDAIPSFSDVDNSAVWVLFAQDKKGNEEFGNQGTAIVGTALGRAFRNGIASSMNYIGESSVNKIDKDGYLLEPMIRLTVDGVVTNVSQKTTSVWNSSFETELKEKHINYAKREGLLNGTYFATDLTAFLSESSAPASLYHIRSANKACRILATTLQKLKGKLYEADGNEIASTDKTDIKNALSNSVIAMKGVEFASFEIVSVSGLNFAKDGIVQITAKAELKRTLEGGNIDIEFTVGGLK